MADFVNTKKVDSYLLNLFKEFLAVQILLKEYAANPTKENLEKLVKEVEGAGESFESFKRIVAFAVKEIDTEDVDKVEGKVTENGIEFK